MAKYVYASNFKLKQCLIYQVETEKSYDITDLVIKFDYFEDINYPTISGRLQLVDSVENLISGLPIQGFERIDISLESSTEDEYQYTFRVYKIDSKFNADRFQTYTLGLISTEALLNEGVRIAKTLKGKPDQLVEGILKEYLKTEKEVNVDPSLYNIIFQPGKKSPFSVINTFKSRSVPQGSNNRKKSKKGADNTAPALSDVNAISASDYSSAGGTAGYFFFENRSGYHFKSVDALCSVEKFNGSKPVATYVQENRDVGGEPTRKILDIDFNNEIDIMSKLRTGAYSSLICFYNYSTGSYEEYAYSLADEYENMGHMGSQEGLPFGQKELSKYPTRIMSVMIDHETWFNGKEVASPEEKDGSEGNSSGFPDFQKHYISQSISRYKSLNNQTASLTVTGNPALMVGDKIEILIPNQLPTKSRVSDQYDPEQSGIYLITELNHSFSPKEANSTTYLTLMRDSYGRKESASTVK